MSRGQGIPILCYHILLADPNSEEGLQVQQSCVTPSDHHLIDQCACKESVAAEATNVQMVCCRKPLQTEDMWDLPPGDKAKKVTSDFDKNWQEELKRPKPSLVRSIVPTCHLLCCLT